MSPEELSNFNNCYLAIERAAEVASFLEYLHENSGEGDAGNYRNQFADTMKKLNNYCAQGQGGALPSAVPNVRIQPWCESEDMKLKRSRFFGLDHGTDDQFHVLNRSVHLEIQDPGNCDILSNRSDPKR